MRCHSLISAAVLAVLPLTSCRHVEVESLRQTPRGWSKVRDADPGQSLSLRIALTQPAESVARFHRRLYDVSTPQHALYGQHLSREQVREYFKPQDGAATAVLDWVKSANCSQVEHDGEWVTIRTTVGAASKMLDTEFGVYRDADTEAERVRTLRYAVPENVKAHVAMIQPTTLFGRIQPKTRRILGLKEFKGEMPSAAVVPNAPLNVTFCNKTATPECIRALYNIQDRVADPAVSASFGISGFLEGFANQAGLAQFKKALAPYSAAQNFTVVKVNGGTDNQTDTEDNLEANLDIQYAAALGFNTKLQFYSVGGRGPLVPDLSEPTAADNFNEPYLELATYLMSLPDAQMPRTLSISYGDNEQEFPPAYTIQVCNIFGQLGARGMSILVASGDEGPGMPCQRNDARNTTAFTPEFPASCPFVTTVGGTAGVQPEVATDFSGGGFSELFPRPDYQNATVAAHLAKTGLAARFPNLFNAQGRAYPDVAAQSKSFTVVNTGKMMKVDGTSAAAPTFAGVVHLLNNARLRAGMPPMGFLNPWLYGPAVADGALTDVTAGGSRGCFGVDKFSNLTARFVPGAGFNATVGWDAVTGLGTPLLDKMLALAAPGARMLRLSTLAAGAQTGAGLVE